jgi:hypothetical protein
MYSWLILEKDSDLNQKYEASMKKAFPHLPVEETSGENIALFKAGEIIGGITLERFDKLDQDESLSRYWAIKSNRPGVRMKRLWSVDRDSKAAILKIFEAVATVADSNAFLYGILALSLKFAQNKREEIDDNLGMLEPKVFIEECSWDISETASSEGSKLYKRYRDLGVQILGEACGCEEDKSIRIAMGMPLEALDRSRLVEGNQ